MNIYVFEGHRIPALAQAHAVSTAKPKLIAETSGRQRLRNPRRSLFRVHCLSTGRDMVTENYFAILKQTYLHRAGRVSNNIDRRCTALNCSAMRQLHVGGNIPGSRPEQWFARASLPSFRLVSLVTSNTALVYDPSEYPPRQLPTPLHGFPDCSRNSGDTTFLINDQFTVCRSGCGRVRVQDHRPARPIVVCRRMDGPVE